MKFNKCLFTLFSTLIISYVPILSNAMYYSMPIWDNNLMLTSNDLIDETQENFLNIESESAILIEQSTRKSSL